MENKKVLCNHEDLVAIADVARNMTDSTDTYYLTEQVTELQGAANVVEQAMEAGVSTKGSTLDILERINHANVVKQAKEAGVSTEGSTLDILERINRKYLEEYLK